MAYLANTQNTEDPNSPLYGSNTANGATTNPALSSGADTSGGTSPTVTPSTSSTPTESVFANVGTPSTNTSTNTNTTVATSPNSTFNPSPANPTTTGTPAGPASFIPGPNGETPTSTPTPDTNLTNPNTGLPYFIPGPNGETPTSTVTGTLPPGVPDPSLTDPKTGRPYFIPGPDGHVPGFDNSTIDTNAQKSKTPGGFTNLSDYLTANDKASNVLATNTAGNVTKQINTAKAAPESTYIAPTSTTTTTFVPANTGTGNNNSGYTDAQIAQFVRDNANNPSAIAAKAAELGLSDTEIARDLGLGGINMTAAQVDQYANQNGYNFNNGGAQANAVVNADGSVTAGGQTYSLTDVKNFVQANQNNPAAIATQAAKMGLSSSQLQQLLNEGGLNINQNDIINYANQNGYNFQNGTLAHNAPVSANGGGALPSAADIHRFFATGPTQQQIGDMARKLGLSPEQVVQAEVVGYGLDPDQVNANTYQSMYQDAETAMGIDPGAAFAQTSFYSPTLGRALTKADYAPFFASNPTDAQIYDEAAKLGLSIGDVQVMMNSLGIDTSDKNFGSVDNRLKTNLAYNNAGGYSLTPQGYVIQGTSGSRDQYNNGATGYYHGAVNNVPGYTPPLLPTTMNELNSMGVYNPNTGGFNGATTPLTRPTTGNGSRTDFSNNGANGGVNTSGGPSGAGNGSTGNGAGTRTVTTNTTAGSWDPTASQAKQQLIIDAQNRAKLLDTAGGQTQILNDVVNPTGVDQRTTNGGLNLDQFIMSNANNSAIPDAQTQAKGLQAIYDAITASLNATHTLGTNSSNSVVTQIPGTVTNTGGTGNSGVTTGTNATSGATQRIPVPTNIPTRVDPRTGALISDTSNGTGAIDRAGGVGEGMGGPDASSAGLSSALGDGPSAATIGGIVGNALGLGPIGGIIGNAIGSALGDNGVDGGIGSTGTGSEGIGAANGGTGVGGSNGIGSGTGFGGNGSTGNGSDASGTMGGANGTGVGGSDGDGGDGFAIGGAISGPGTGTSDSIDARLSNGEYVIPADIVQRYGKNFFDHLLGLNSPGVQREQNKERYGNK